jgi:hypothetical protein
MNSIDVAYKIHSLNRGDEYRFNLVGKCTPKMGAITEGLKLAKSVAEDERLTTAYKTKTIKDGFGNKIAIVVKCI